MADDAVVDVRDPNDEGAGGDVLLPSSAAVASLEELFREQYLPMVRLAHVMTGSNQAAEDLVQEAFVRMHRHWHRVDNPVSYLRAIVMNGCRSWRRRRVLERDRRPELPGWFEDREVDETLGALAALSPRQRAAIVLRFYEDLPDAEIARLLRCREATVRSHVHRGLHRLKEVLAP